MRSWLIKGWREFAHRAGTYQSRMMLTLTYLLVLGPFASLGQLFGSRLMDMSADPAKSSWSVRPAPESSLDELRRQF